MAGNAFNQGTNNAIVVKSYFAQYDKGSSAFQRAKRLLILLFFFLFFCFNVLLFAM
jgi:hypothetical protein